MCRVKPNWRRVAKHHCKHLACQRCFVSVLSCACLALDLGIRIVVSHVSAQQALLPPPSLPPPVASPAFSVCCSAVPMVQLQLQLRLRPPCLRLCRRLRVLRCARLPVRANRACECFERACAGRQQRAPPPTSPPSLPRSLALPLQPLRWRWRWRWLGCARGSL